MLMCADGCFAVSRLPAMPGPAGRVPAPDAAAPPVQRCGRADAGPAAHALHPARRGASSLSRSTLACLPFLLFYLRLICLFQVAHAQRELSLLLITHYSPQTPPSQPVPLHTTQHLSTSPFICTALCCCASPLQGKRCVVACQCVCLHCKQH